MVKGLEHLRRAGKTGTIDPKGEKSQGDLINLYQNLTGGCKCKVVPGNRIRGNGQKMEHLVPSEHLETLLSLVRVTEHLSRLLRRVCICADTP